MREERRERRRRGLRCAVLSCAVDNLYLCIHMCCSKPLTFHNGCMFFSSRSCFMHLYIFM